MLTQHRPAVIGLAAAVALGSQPAVAAGGDPICHVRGEFLVCEDPPTPPTPPGDPGDPPDDPVDPPKPPVCPGPGCGSQEPLSPCYFHKAPWVNCYWPYRPGGSPGDRETPRAGKEGEAAEKAIAELRLPVPEIGSAPCTKDGCMGGVGVPVWLWVGNDWGPKSATARISSGSITATARPARVEWDMGDGTRFECGRGTPYQASFGLQESPTCGHVYQQTSADQPNQRYALAADLVWDVEVTGEVNMDFQVATRDVVFPAIGEYQSVINGRGGDTR